MSQREIEEFFNEYFDRMRRDLGREIQFQRDNPDTLAGNVLVALGLLTYTEVLGRLMLWNPSSRAQRRRNPSDGRIPFYAFLDRLDGGWYGAWRRRWQSANQVDLYDVLRNGLAHQYVPKVAARLWFNFGAPYGFEDVGWGILQFNLEPYYRHFCEEGRKLHDDLKNHWDPLVPLERRIVPVSPPGDFAADSG